MFIPDRSQSYMDIGHGYDSSLPGGRNVDIFIATKSGMIKTFSSTDKSAHFLLDEEDYDYQGRIDHNTKEISLTTLFSRNEKPFIKVAMKLRIKYPDYRIHVFDSQGIFVMKEETIDEESSMWITTTQYPSYMEIGHDAYNEIEYKNKPSENEELYYITSSGKIVTRKAEYKLLHLSNESDAGTIPDAVAFVVPPGAIAQGRIDHNQKLISAQFRGHYGIGHYKADAAAMSLRTKYPNYKIYSGRHLMKEETEFSEETQEIPDDIRRWRKNNRKRFKEFYGDEKGSSKIEQKTRAKTRNSPVVPFVQYKRTRKHPKPTQSATSPAVFSNIKEDSEFGPYFSLIPDLRYGYLAIGHLSIKSKSNIDLYIFDGKRLNLHHLDTDSVTMDADPLDPDDMYRGDTHSTYFPRFNYSKPHISGRIDHDEKAISMIGFPYGKVSKEMFYDFLYLMQKKYSNYKIIFFNLNRTYIAKNVLREENDEQEELTETSRFVYAYGPEKAQQILQEAKSAVKVDTLKEKHAYLVNKSTLQIYQISDTFTHTKAILNDATKGGKKFGVKKTHLTEILKKYQFESILDMIDAPKSDYNWVVLSLAANNGWVRVTTYSDGFCEIQGNSYEDMIPVLRKMMQEIYISKAVLEIYAEVPTPKTLNNKREMINFLRTGKFVRLKSEDFR